ncbi:unnamed protein product [Rotaria sp. Silwood2]|nr:unnamed protein product [Rotaria sp. Silwood2]
MSKLLAEVIHYYLNEYLVNQINDTNNPEDQITRKQIETIESYFKEAIEKQDYLTYFIKAYTLTNFFYKVLNRNLALYILEYFDETKTFSSNYRLVNCLVHIVTLLIYNPNLPQYQYQGICYRGMRITQNDFNQYQLNQHVLNRTFLSTSTDRQVAAMFAGEGQQSQMRYTPNNHCALQYSCLCQYLIKQNSTAMDIQSISTRPDEKEILIIPFSVFKVMKIKRNYLDDSTASISIEIELEECEDVIDDKKESESKPTSRSSSLSSSDNDIKEINNYVKFKQRKYLLYGIVGILTLVALLALTFIFIFTFVVKKSSPKNTINNTTTASETNDIFDYYLPPSCPNILNQSNWNSRPYLFRENLTTFPVTHIVIRQLGDSEPILNQQDCIRNIKDLQDFQMDKLGWADIGFNFLICNYNDDQQQIYRGRGWINRGAHCRGHNYNSLVTHIVIRQLGDSEPILNQQDCIRNIKDLQDFQMDTLGWADIGFNFLICNYNDDQQQIYRGRGWINRGAHCRDYNYNSLGIGNIGNYATRKSLSTFKSLIKCGITKNAIVQNFILVGHDSSTDIYEYYLQYFSNDSEFQYNNQADSIQYFCQES